MSLYGMMRTGVSGMNAQSTRLATVADNIANSGTNGYKRSSVEFSSLVVPNTGTSYVSGGVATQIRYAISQAGNLQHTTSATDLAINNGPGFFVVQNASGQPFMTRAGAFVPDDQGRLVNAAGFYLMGYSYENGIPSTVANGYAGLETVKISGKELQATPTTFGTFAANLPYTAEVVTGNTPADNVAASEFTKKTSLIVYDNVGQEVLLDIFYTKTGAGTLAATVAGPDVSTYSETAIVAAATNTDFTFAGFTGLAWSDGDTASFTIDIDGTAVDVTGTFNGGVWSFAPNDPAAVPAGVTISYSTNSAGLFVNVDNATGTDIAVTIGGFSSTTTTWPGPDVSTYSATGIVTNDTYFTFAGFTSLAWSDGDITSFTVDIDGTAVDVNGTFNGGVWNFEPDDPATVPAGVDISYSTSSTDLSVFVHNSTGTDIDVTIDGFSSTTTPLGPDVSAYSGIGTVAAATNTDFTFADFTGLAWSDGDTASFTVDIDGTAVDVTGTFNGGIWNFEPGDPATVPIGVTISYDTSGADLVVNVDNASGADIAVTIDGFSSTTTLPATNSTWEMTVFYQPNAAATTSFPYADPPGALSTITLEFDNTGKLVGPANIDIDLTLLNGEVIELDISSMTQLATDYTPLEANMNGNAPAAIKQVMIGADGNVYAEYANGATTALYKLPLATVASPDRLEVLPGNVFSAGLESGSVQMGFAGEGGLGAVISGALENSNVDIAEELTNMIESQRNYTANSKVFQTGSDLMDVLVNLKR